MVKKIMKLFLISFIFIFHTANASILSQFFPSDGSGTTAENMSTSTADGHYYSVGGSPCYCKQKSILNGGKLSTMNVNDSGACSNGTVCSGGVCGAIGGTVKRMFFTSTTYNGNLGGGLQAPTLSARPELLRLA